MLSANPPLVLKRTSYPTRDGSEPEEEPNIDEE